MPFLKNIQLFTSILLATSRNLYVAVPFIWPHPCNHHRGKNSVGREYDNEAIFAKLLLDFALREKSKLQHARISHNYYLSLTRKFYWVDLINNTYGFAEISFFHRTAHRLVIYLAHFLDINDWWLKFSLKPWHLIF